MEYGYIQFVYYQVKNCQGIIFRDLETELQDKLPSQRDGSNELFELPSLMVEGIPTTIDEMNQVYTMPPIKLNRNLSLFMRNVCIFVMSV